MRQVNGGFDGILVSFGDGADDDTFDTVFGHALRHYCVQLKIRTPGARRSRVVDAIKSETFRGDDGFVWLRFNPYDDENDCALDPEEVPLSEVIGVKVW